MTYNAMQSAASACGWVAGLLVAGFIGWQIYTGGIGLPSGRYPVILLAALFVGPPFIAGCVSGGLTYLAVLKSLEAVDNARTRKK